MKPQRRPSAIGLRDNRNPRQVEEVLDLLRGRGCSACVFLEAQAAAGLGVSRKTLSLLLNGHAGISPETLAPARSAGVAVRLSKAFGRTPPGRLAALD